jgi:hypothetical protein
MKALLLKVILSVLFHAETFRSFIEESSLKKDLAGT